MRAKWATTLIIGMVLAAPAMTACSSTESSTAAPTAAATASADAADRAAVEAFVTDAVEYVRENGQEAALATFTEPGGPFHQGELYIYAYNFDGTVIAHGGDPNLVGQNLADMTDPNGVKVIQQLSAVAQSGSGWLEYIWPNPAQGNADQLKLGYVEKVNDTWFLGSGYYLQ